jgi:glycosyltransferase involved in cell wall biosynthesis
MKIFIAGYDVMGKKMAGPGMRSYAIAMFLSAYADVTLSHCESSDINSNEISFKLISDSDVKWESDTFWQNFDFAIMPASQNLKFTLPEYFPIPLVVDIYDPYILENIELLSDKKPSIREYEYLRHLKAMIEMLLLGDRFLVTSDRTKDFFLGMLASWGVLNPVSASKDKSEKLFLEIPFGVTDEPFDESYSKSSKELPGNISPDDDIILWAGGLWDWLEPQSVINAMPDILKNHPNAKLLFMGYKHPNKHVPVMDTAYQCIDMAKKLNLHDKSIIFREWTPFEERIPLLNISKIGVSLHKKHIETRFSFRTRLMDYIWAGIPMVLSGGDVLSEELSSSGVAVIVLDNKPKSIADAVSKLLDKPDKADISQTFDNLRLQYRWETVLAPIAEMAGNIQKIEKSNYQNLFRDYLKEFPVPPAPGLIDRGIEKIKKKLR